MVALGKAHQHTDPPDRTLLRACGERPYGHSATDKTEKFPPLHVCPLALEMASYRLKRVL